MTNIWWDTEVGDRDNCGFIVQQKKENTHKQRIDYTCVYILSSFSFAVFTHIQTAWYERLHHSHYNSFEQILIDD